MDGERIVRVGIAGLGRSGWGIHADGLGRVPEQYRVVAVHDVLSERLADSAAALGARAHDTFAGLLADADVDLVVVASPNKFHFDQALAALDAGKHVVCEKPFGTTAAEADRLIAAADRAGRFVQPFQQRRYEADFQKVRSVLASGVLGRFEFARICWHGFKRRWDWQTIPEMAAGELYNNGPHPIDHAMLLLGDTDETPVTPEVWCERRRGLTSGAGEDHVKIILRAPDGPTVEIEISSLVAFGQDRGSSAARPADCTGRPRGSTGSGSTGRRCPPARWTRPPRPTAATTANRSRGSTTTGSPTARPTPAAGRPRPPSRCWRCTPTCTPP